MLPRLRRSAGLLFVLFAGHLGMVTSGAVCITPGMAAMSSASSSEDTPMADMASSSMSQHAAEPGSPDGLATPEHAPCSSPAQGTCVTGMPCATALGASATEGLASFSRSLAGDVIALTVSMPVSSGAAPDLPPPRA